MKYSMNVLLHDNAFDAKGNITPFAVLNVFQDAANIHAEGLGVSFAEMLKKNLLWVVTRIRFEVCANLSQNSEVTVTTWPLAPSRFGYERDYLITDTNGNILVRGSSNWAVIDANTRKLCSTESLYNISEHSTDRAFESRSNRIRNFDSDNLAYKITPDSSMIDCNNHVNNTYYAAFAQTALGDMPIRVFQIDYHKEVLCGQEIRLFTTRNEDIFFVKGENFDGEVMFCASAQS